VQELLNPILLPNGVHVGDLLLGYRGEVQVHLHNKTIIVVWNTIRNGAENVREEDEKERRTNSRNMDIKTVNF
jgi:hypothetical protein